MVMGKTLAEVEKDVMELPYEDREILAHRLFGDMQSVDPEIEKSWGDEADRRLADRFTEQIESNVKEITDLPEGFPLIHRRARNCVLLKFPYSILYANTEVELFIVAVMHHKRHPDYWKSRLKDIPA